MVKKYIHQNYSRHIALDDLCDMFRCSKSTLMNTFRAAYGTTVGKYITDVRIDRARHLLTETDKPIREISSDCGFADQGYFTKVFFAATGYPPSEFRRRLREEKAEAEAETEREL
jgi:AraC-like DNA-binding protein